VYSRGGTNEAKRAKCFEGKVVGVIKGVTTHNVKIDIGHGIVLTSSITAEAVRDLKLKKGDEAYAIIKASEVIVGKD
jgi:molybdopterin-binding protein